MLPPMSFAPKTGPRPARRWKLLLAYGALAALGFGLGTAAKPGEPAAPSGIEERIRRAIETVRSESAVDPDAGVAVDAAAPRGVAPSPEPEGDPDGGLPDWRRLPAADPAGGSGRAVVIVEIEDIIDMGLAAFVRRAISSNQDAAAIVFDINTPGGRVDAATAIRDAIMDAPVALRTVAFVNPRAISAGAFISLACDLIFIAEGGSIGAATPIAIGGGGEAEAVDEKMVSYFRTEMATTARAKGRRGDIAEAMVDADIEIEGVTPAGKLLTLDTAGALRHGIADARAADLDDVLSKLALGGAERRVLGLNWAEELARILTHPILSGLLMSIGVLGILIELYQPGFGLPGIVGLTCLAVFFAGHLVVHMAGWEELLLFAAGVILLFVEVFVTPGFGVVGILGVLLIVGSLVFSLSGMPLEVAFDTGLLTTAVSRVLISLGGSIALFFAALAILPRTRVRNRLVLSAAIDSTAAGGVEGEALAEVLAQGLTGVAESFLRPAGIARFGERRIDVVSEGDFIEQGAKVVIVRTAGNRVVVREER